MAENYNLGELLPIKENNGQKAVNARDLHSFLESKQQFADWIKSRINQYGFVENQDYQVFHNSMKNPLGGRPTEDYALSIDMAKELSMVERNERGKEARKYFIACEQKLKEVATQQLPSKKELALMVIQAEEEKERLMLENKKQQEQIEASRPAVAFTAAVQAAQSSCLVGELAKIISQNGVEIGEKRLFKWLREHKYLGSHGERYNIPNQEYIERGYFELKKGVRSGSNGVMHITSTTKVTGKGQVYFINKFLNSNGMGGLQYAN